MLRYGPRPAMGDRSDFESMVGGLATVMERGIDEAVAK